MVHLDGRMAARIARIAQLDRVAEVNRGIDPVVDRKLGEILAEADAWRRRGSSSGSFVAPPSATTKALQLLTCEQVAIELGKSARWVRYEIANGHLKAALLGNTYGVTHEDLDEYRATGRRPA